MADSALPGLDPLQREWLQAMGYELYELRQPAAAAAETAGASQRPATDAAPAARLCLLGVDPASQDRLLAALLRVLGVDPGQLSGQPQPGVPAIAFGPDANADVQAPALAQLRSAAAKRALWPALRRLRRRLAGAAAPQ